jgi:hypothetical protein
MYCEFIKRITFLATNQSFHILLLTSVNRNVCTSISCILHEPHGSETKANEFPSKNCIFIWTVLRYDPHGLPSILSWFSSSIIVRATQFS